MFLLKVLLFPFILHSYIFGYATFCQCCASHTAALQCNYRVLQLISWRLYRGRERLWQEFWKSLFHLLPAHAPGERREKGSVGDWRKGERGVVTYLHWMRIDWNALEAYAVLQAQWQHYKTKENTFLSQINPGDIEILSFVDKPWTKISLCPTMSSCFHTDVSRFLLELGNGKSNGAFLCSRPYRIWKKKEDLYCI